MDLKEVGALVRQVRKKQKITQVNLATACGLSRATISALESGSIQELGFGRVNAIGEFLGLEFSFSRSSTRAAQLPSESKLLKQLQERYIWWSTPGAEPNENRVIAQVMNLGTYEDVKALENTIGRSRMKQVVAEAQPGWFSPKSWNYWHLILGLSKMNHTPPLPTRTYDLHPQL